MFAMSRDAENALMPESSPPHVAPEAEGSASRDGIRKTFRRRTRAATACTRCHHRKVRCDLTLRQPCTNCLLDGENCAARERQRRGPPPLHGKSVDAEEVRWEASPDRIDLVTDRAESAEPSQPSTATHDTEATFTHSRQRVLRDESSSPQRGPVYPSSQSDIIYSAYSFVSVTGLSKLPQEDIQFLELKSCLRLPTRPFLDEFIRQYFRYVHPCLPVLNEAEFWDLYNADESDFVPGRRPLSLFVLQAMLYVSSAFVSPETIKAAGYKYVKHARKVFYVRAKILHDLSAEQCSLSRAIGALILTHRFNQEDRQAGSIWLGIAIQNARASHDGPWGSGSLPSQGPLKRLWSCIHLRDRIISMGLRRPMQLPSIQDIEANALTDEDLADETHQSQVYDAPTKRRLSHILVQQYRLAVLMGEVMRITQHQGARPDTSTASASTGNKNKLRLPAIQERLQQWHDDAIASFDNHSQVKKPHLSAVMFSNITLIYYHATNISLATYELRQLTKEQSLVNNPTLRAEKKLEQIRQKLKLACSQTERLAMLFVNHGVVECLPMTVLSYLAFPLLLRVLETNSIPSGNDRFLTEHPVYCAQVIKQCDTRYEGGDHVLSLIRQATASMSEYRQLSVSLKNTAPGAGAFNKRPRGDAADESMQRTVSTAWERLLLMKPALFGQISDSFYDAMSRGKGINTDNFPSLLEASLSTGMEAAPTRVNEDSDLSDVPVNLGSAQEEEAESLRARKRRRAGADCEEIWGGTAGQSPDLGQSRMFELGSADAEPDLALFGLPDMAANWWEFEQTWAEDLFEDVSQIPA